MEIHHVMFTSGGEDIGSFSITYGWGAQKTKEEHSRYVEMGALYEQTWKNEMQQIQMEKNN